MFTCKLSSCLHISMCLNQADCSIKPSSRAVRCDHISLFRKPRSRKRFPRFTPQFAAETVTDNKTQTLCLSRLLVCLHSHSFDGITFLYTNQTNQDSLLHEESYNSRSNTADYVVICRPHFDKLLSACVCFCFFLL